MTDTMIDTTTTVAEAKAEAKVRRLAGQAKNHLDDLLLLNEKTSEEMARGIRDRYLDPEGAIELANRLGIAPPRVKRDFTVFYTMTQVYSIRIKAFTEAEARQEGERLHQFNVANSDIHYGSQSRFGVESGTTRRYFSEILWDRPQPSVQQALHPWEVERGAAYAANRDNFRHQLQERLNYNTAIPAN